ncbi:MAG: peroxiredoxin-like family protein [Pseudomonadota bacterium]
MLMPRKKTPELSVQTLDNSQFDLDTAPGERGTLICFYRGYHCPICATYLTELERLAGDFAERGVNVIAISSDSEERARLMADKIKADKLHFGYGLPLTLAREWGLYISTSRGTTSIGVDEPALFSEPGVFLVSPDRSLYFGVVQTMPFVRPHFKDFIGALDFVIANDYPARGEYDGPV